MVEIVRRYLFLRCSTQVVRIPNPEQAPSDPETPISISYVIYENLTISCFVLLVKQSITKYVPHIEEIFCSCGSLSRNVAVARERTEKASENINPNGWNQREKAWS